ncbi:MAG TPA: hypothetical protein VK956_01715 [Verrucomicrobium sp.]|nr:hypothetical protein [Verrucomicrobium sp.]
MKTPTLMLPVAILFTALAPALSAKDITLVQTPASVQEVVKQNLAGGTVDEVDHVTVKGLSMYVVEIKQPNSPLERKLYLNEAGKILKTRDDIALKDVPAAVREAAQKLAGTTGKVDDVDKETAEGKITYRVEIDRADKDGGDLKVVINEDGSVASQMAD